MSAVRPLDLVLQPSEQMYKDLPDRISPLEASDRCKGEG